MIGAARPLAPVFALGVAVALAACERPEPPDPQADLQAVAESGDPCLEFAERFGSVGVRLTDLDPDFPFMPLPDSLRMLEAGFDPACRVGGVADIEIQCPVGDDPRARVIIRDAPVVWTDADGFTVVIISLRDHERLEGRDLFWATCGGPGDWN
jgi:hypothetical protein